MKVEFSNCEFGIGVGLYVATSEFLKADKSEEEYTSLAAATDAFSNLHGVDYYISREDYDMIKKWVKPSGAVIFTINTDRYERRKWCDIYVSADNHFSRIIGSDDGDGRFVKAKPNFNKSSQGRQQNRKKVEPNE